MSASTAIHPAARTSRGLTDDLRPVLERRVYAVIATLNDDGTAHVAPVMFLSQDERIIIETGAATRKARNVAVRGHASVLVQTPEAAWVLADGPASILREEDAERHRDRLRAKYLTAEGRFACDALLDEMDDVIIVVQPTHWLSWDLTTFLGSLAKRGVDPTHADTWFLADD